MPSSYLALPAFAPPSSLDFALHPWQGRFCHPSTERAFQRHQLRHSHTQLRLTLSFCAAFYVAFSLTDVAALGYGFHTLKLLLARSAADAPIPLALAAGGHRHRGRGGGRGHLPSDRAVPAD